MSTPGKEKTEGEKTLPVLKRKDKPLAGSTSKSLYLMRVT